MIRAKFCFLIIRSICDFCEYSSRSSSSSPSVSIKNHWNISTKWCVFKHSYVLLFGQGFLKRPAITLEAPCATKQMKVSLSSNKCRTFSIKSIRTQINFEGVTRRKIYQVLFRIYLCKNTVYFPYYTQRKSEVQYSHQARILGNLAKRKHKDKHVINMNCQDVSLNVATQLSVFISTMKILRYTTRC